jgi:isopentenyl-diphosphate delta-isomerase
LRRRFIRRRQRSRRLKADRTLTGFFKRAYWMSDNSGNVILVDVFDREAGSLGKLEAHRRPRLHRAFSIFLYDGSRLLLQKRAAGKYHSGGLWTNSCCSHPRAGEALMEAAARRLGEELGLEAPLVEIASFVYYHKFAEDLYEYEFDHVLAGAYGGPVSPDPEEASQVEWVDGGELATGLLERPEAYSAWFRTAAPIALAWLRTGRPRRGAPKDSSNNT